MQNIQERKKHLENIEHDVIIIPEWFFKEKQTPMRKKKSSVEF